MPRVHGRRVNAPQSLRRLRGAPITPTDGRVRPASRKPHFGKPVVRGVCSDHRNPRPRSGRMACRSRIHKEHGLADGSQTRRYAAVARRTKCSGLSTTARTVQKGARRAFRAPFDAGQIPAWTCRMIQVRRIASMMLPSGVSQKERRHEAFRELNHPGGLPRILGTHRADHNVTFKVAQCVRDAVRSSL